MTKRTKVPNFVNSLLGIWEEHLGWVPWVKNFWWLYQMENTFHHCLAVLIINYYLIYKMRNGLRILNYTSSRLFIPLGSSERGQTLENYFFIPKWFTVLFYMYYNRSQNNKNHYTKSQNINRLPWKPHPIKTLLVKMEGSTPVQWIFRSLLHQRRNTVE